MLRLPLYVEASKLRVLVVGGGNVGTRRALMFHDAGAKVKVVSLVFSDKLRKAAEKSDRLELLRINAFDQEEMKRLTNWANVVVIATDNPELNKMVSRIARQNDCLVNNATDASDADIVVPFEVTVDGIRVAVTTEGKAGVVARIASERIKNLLEKDVELLTMMKAMSKAKEYMKEKIGKAKDRLPLYFEIEKDKVFREHAKRGDVEGAWRRAKELVDARIEELQRSSQRSF